MQKIKFDFDATKERIYAPNSNVPIGAPVDRNGNIANDGNAYGIVLCKETENEKYWVRYNLVVMVAGYCDIIDAQAIWGDEYSAEAMAAMSDITFCDNHELPTGGGSGGGMVVNFTYTYDEETETDLVTSDKTQDEIIEAMQAGIVVSGKIIFDEEIVPVGYAILDFHSGPENRYVAFGFVASHIDSNSYVIFHDNESDSWILSV